MSHFQPKCKLCFRSCQSSFPVSMHQKGLVMNNLTCKAVSLRKRAHGPFTPSGAVAAVPPPKGFGATLQKCQPYTRAGIFLPHRPRPGNLRPPAARKISLSNHFFSFLPHEQKQFFPQNSGNPGWRPTWPHASACCPRIWPSGGHARSRG